MKKRMLAMVMCVCMVGSMVLSGCGSNGNSNGGGNKSGDESTNKNNSSVKGYAFEAKGVKMSVDMDMSEIEDKLGEPVSYYEEPSCAAQGTARLFTYSGFEIDTYPDGDKDLVACIILKDDTVSTAEGIDLSMTKEDVIAKYGDNYEESENRIVYEKDEMKLCFIFDGDNIASIEYNSVVLN